MSVVQSTLRISLLEDVVAKSAPIFRTLDRLQGQQMKAFAPMRGLIGQAVALGAGYLGATEGISATAGAAIEFETAFADVKKVVEATDEQFENMRRSIRRMSGEIPLAATDIAALFAAAGESGVATEDLQGFAEMAARVGVAFDMTAADAGESLAKLKTQLGLNVAETGEMADAINHLSNNMASKAKDVTEFMLRVGAIGEMSGFVKEDVAAMGSAMIAAGSDASTAGTAMKNVIRALARGDFAKKSQREAAKALGLHLPTIAKDMQKDAKGTLRKVLTAIAKAPKHQQTSLLSEFFGDEASAFMPLVGNIQLLDKALASVADRTKYSGSAFAEYVQRANTTRNVLDLLGNKISNKFAEMGDSMLPAIREGALGIGEVLDSLGSRVTLLDEITNSVKGFAQGFGYTGGMKEFMNDLGNLLLGPVDPNAADRIGEIFMRAKDWGASIRELNDAIKNNPIAKFLAEMSGYGFQLFLYAAGIAMLAGTIRKLAGALMLLSGASTALSILKTIGTLSEFPGLGGDGGKPGGKAPKGGGGNVPEVLPWYSQAGQWLKGFGSQLGFGLSVQSLGDTPGDTFQDQVNNQQKYKEGLQKLFGLNEDASGVSGWDSFWFGDAAKPDFSFREHAGISGVGGTGGGAPATATASGQPVLARIDAGSIAEMVKPNGTQDVRVTNREPVSVTVHNQISITGVSDPEAAGNAAAAQVGEKVRQGVESSYSD
ncbi:phage tail tape measure protein [Agrobacterium tumefaciens]|uniref:phage tail tape measure protein n=1 Tax=Agrobacterium tumefaciens TaxID=358 RepID=UPI0022440C4D|nr:phage tail tape measure protein [Agrobacterium tumefaciens]MCW8059311.1 phage tail tape measure protein [Agrobacterium tumefaciens]MCW8147115.1 phage tail tape measure protein [Agrobacterium tumefaciens]